MEYQGKLYGLFADKYFDTGVTSEDYDKLKEENQRLKNIIKSSEESSNDSPWIEFNGNQDLFNIEAKKNYRLLFDKGSECNFNEDHPLEIMTHFKLASIDKTNKISIEVTKEGYRIGINLNGKKFTEEWKSSMFGSFCKRRGFRMNPKVLEDLQQSLNSFSNYDMIRALSDAD